MKTNKLLLLLLLATTTFSCNNQQTNESKNATTSDSAASQTIENVITQDTTKSVEQNNVVEPSVNNSTTAAKQIVKSTMTLADIYKQLDKTPQVFSLLTSKDTTIICAEGTSIKIKAKSFVSETTGKEITGNIQISIKEYYKLSDILLARLSTTTNGNLLETAGMIYISASSNNENCILKQGQKINIGFPAKERKVDMQLYTGNWKSDYQINWELVSNSVDQNKVFTTVDENAAFPGGDQKMMQFINKTISYPEKAMEQGIQGTVYIGFVVDQDGNVTNARVLKGIDLECDKAALAAIKGLPKMTPAKLKGENVSVNFTLPITFSLDGGPTYNVDYKKNFEKTYSDTTIQNASSNSISNYLFSSSTLGWINCDRLWKNNSAPSINYIVKLNDIEKSNANVVFHRFKAVLNGYPSSNGFSFPSIPSGEQITLVAIKYIDDKPYLAIKETQTSLMTEKELEFKPVTMELLKEEMKKLDRFN